MAPSKSILSILLIFPSLFHLCLSDGAGPSGIPSGGTPSDSLNQLLSNVGTQVQNLQDAQAKAQCMQKLLPCQPFLKTPINPPPACCNPLSELANNGTDCLCTFLNDPKMLSTMNLSNDEVMKLPNACGVKVDFSKCNNSGGGAAVGGAAAGGAAATAGGAAATAGGADQAVDKEKQTSSSSTRMTSPYGITLFVTMLIVLVFSAY